MYVTYGEKEIEIVKKGIVYVHQTIMKCHKELIGICQN